MFAYFKRILFLFTLLTALSAGSIGAARIQATAELDSTNLLMGTLTRLSIKIDKPADGTKISFPLVEKGKGRSYIGISDGEKVELSQLKIDTTTVDGKSFINYNMTVQAFDSGKYKLPPFELIVGNDTAVTNELSLNVIPVKVKADDDIEGFSDVSEPFEVTMADGENREPTFWERVLDLWWLILLLLIFIGVLIYGIYRYKKTGSILPVKKPLPPFDQAILSMRKLKDRQLWESGKEKEYFTGLTDILRIYLDKQFGINAMEMTSRQIIKALKKDGRLRQHRDVVRPVLELADFVKFAKQKPLAEENIKSFNDILQFLNATKPVEEIQTKEGGKK